MELHEKLRQYNRWRRGEEDWEPSERGPCPKELGELIDGAADRMEVLEREHAEFFEHWHEHRRALEAIVRVLGPAAPTCDGCAAEIAEALRIARKVGADSEALERPNK